MKKELSEMLLGELWELFPIVLTPYNEQWSIWYNDFYGNNPEQIISGALEIRTF